MDSEQTVSLRQPPPADIIPHHSVNPRQLLPLESPPTALANYPKLPFPRDETFTSDYNVSSHVFPAAYPRCPSDLWTAPPLSESPVEKQARIRQAVQTLSALKEVQEQGKDLRPPRQQVYWTVANRYVHKSRPTAAGLTLVFLHGIGAHKETWEPIITRLLEQLDAFGSSIHIQEIWTLDGVQHGDSGLLNEHVMGDIFDLADYARDLTSFLLSYLPQDVAAPGSLPINLSRVSDSVNRKTHGIPGRTIVGIGHSGGACAFTLSAVEYPALFSLLVLVESFTVPEFMKHLDTHRKNEAMCLSRRWMWPTREDAIQDLAKSRYYSNWDPKALGALIQFGLVQLPDGSVRTKTHPYLEAVMLFERCAVYEAWELLEKIEPSIAMHWVWGGKSARQGGPGVQAQTSYRRAQNSTNDFHPDLGHLLPQEAPDVLGSDICRFLVGQYDMPGRNLSRL